MVNCVLVWHGISYRKEITMSDTKARENRLRRRLAKMGYLLRKSRASESLDNFGGYMIVDAYRNYVVAGSRFDLDLDDLEQFITA